MRRATIQKNFSEGHSKATSEDDLVEILKNSCVSYTTVIMRRTSIKRPIRPLYLRAWISTGDL